MQTVRGESENYVAGLDFAAVDHVFAIDHPNDAAGEIVFAFAVHSRQLRGLAANQCATGTATSARKATKELIEHCGM